MQDAGRVMRQLVTAVLTAVLLLLLIKCWDLVMHTNDMKVLLNVDFITADSSTAEQLGYHIMTGIPLYLMLSAVHRYAVRFYTAAVVTAFLVTCSLYIILPALAVQSITLSAAGAAGWFICHLIYFSAVHAVISRL